ncbi:MAG: hypothetical protein ACM3KM_00555 [Acidobacteriaceae bacterium]
MKKSFDGILLVRKQVAIVAPKVLESVKKHPKKLVSATLLVAMLAMTAVLGIPSGADAAGITVGNPAVSRAVVDTYSDFTIIDTNNPVSGNGWLTSFSYYAQNTNSFEFVLVDSTNVVKWISSKITPPATGLQIYNSVVAVETGWNLGVHFDLTGTIPFDYVGDPAIYTPNNNGMPTVGQKLSIEGSSGRTYSWNGNGTEAMTCSTISLVSGTNTEFKHLTLSNPGSSSDDSLFTLGTTGAAVQVQPDGFPGAWDAASNDPDVSGAIWVNDTAIAPTPSGIEGQNGGVDVWRLFSQSFNIPAGATVSSAVLHFTADNSVEAFLDNSSVGSAPSYTTVNDVSLTLTPGQHELEFVVKNDAYTGATNPTGLLYKADVNYCVPNAAPECPAAPSIAAAYLKSLGIKSNSAVSKNIISQVAHKMGPQTDFSQVHACDLTGYSNAVKAYVNGFVIETFSAPNSKYYNGPTSGPGLYGNGPISFSWNKLTGVITAGYYTEIVPPSSGTTYYNVVTTGTYNSVTNHVDITFTRTSPNAYGPFYFHGTLIGGVLSGQLDGAYLFTATGAVTP